MAVTKQNVKAGVKYSGLNLQNNETDRFRLDERGAMQITKFRIDTKTKWFEAGNPEKRGVLKFDGFDIATGEPVKYFTTSKVIFSAIDELMEVIGEKEEVIDNQKWMVFISPVDIDGIEMVSTGVKNYNPYPKIKINQN